MTGIGRTDITVVTIRRRSAGAHSADTHIHGCTGIAVAARGTIRRVLAAESGMAAVIRTQVAIGTVSRTTRRTSSGRANIVAGARVSITAWGCVMDVLASHTRNTAVVRAWITIIAIQCGSRDARIGQTGLHSIAYIAIVAIGIQHTASRHRSAGRAQAGLTCFFAVAKQTVGARGPVRFVVGCTCSRAIAGVGVCAVCVGGRTA